MFLTRLISGAVLLAAAFFLVNTGGIFLLLVSAVLALIGMYEFYRVIKIEKKNISYVGYIFAVIYYVFVYIQSCGCIPAGIFGEYCSFTAAASLIMLMGIYVFTFPKYKIDDICGIFFGMFYVAVLFSFLYKTRILYNGKYLVWLIFLSSWGSDTCAYTVGMLIGKHKIAPELSPKKSVEGCVGGVCGAALLGFIYAWIFLEKMDAGHDLRLICGIACALGSIISQIGDFAASAIKRNYDIKDYGNLIPGHGGVLDRFDSMLFTAPAIYFALYFFI